MCNEDTSALEGVWQLLPLKKQPTESEYASTCERLRFHVREDPSRVLYPLNNGSDTKDLSETSILEELSPAGVYKVRVGNTNNDYFYKEIDRPMYEPRDSEVLEQELRNVKLILKA